MRVRGADELQISRGQGSAWGNRVIADGWIPADEFPRVPAAADLGVVLRTPSAGETSAAAVRFLACGVPVAVGGLHQFLEWPESAAPRLTPGPSTAADLAQVAGRGGGRQARIGHAGSVPRAKPTRPSTGRREMPSVLVEFLESL